METGDTVTFNVIELFYNPEGAPFIKLEKDGTYYHVSAYDFQTEWDNNLPKTMRCYVKKINSFGHVYLEQIREDYLKALYNEPGKTYTFKIIDIEQDQKTNALFYIIRDVYGLTQRYYPQKGEPTYKLNESVDFKLISIEYKEQNRSFLKLEPVCDNGSQGDLTNTKNQMYLLKEQGPFGYEDQHKEFKSSLVFPAGKNEADIDRQCMIITKTIAGFLNSEGGTLYIGVNDLGYVCGINDDFSHLNDSTSDDYSYHNNLDSYELKIRNMIKFHLTDGSYLNGKYIHVSMHEEKGLYYAEITVSSSDKPVFYDGIKLYQRTGNSTSMLKDNEIISFIKDYSRSNSTKNIKNNTKDEINGDVTILQPSPITMSANSDSKKVWHYFTFYQNGFWSFQDKPATTIEKVYELPVMKDLKNERLFMCYNNGCVNVVTPYQIISPVNKTTGKHAPKTKGKIYKNGWNFNATIINMFLLHAYDYFAVFSHSKDGTEFVKVHQATALTIHDSLQLQGNKVIGSEYLVDKICPIEGMYKHQIENALYKDQQNASAIGISKYENFGRVYASVVNACEKSQQKKSNKYIDSMDDHELSCPLLYTDAIFPDLFVVYKGGKFGIRICDGSAGMGMGPVNTHNPEKEDYPYDDIAICKETDYAFIAVCMNNKWGIRKISGFAHNRKFEISYPCRYPSFELAEHFLWETLCVPNGIRIDAWLRPQIEDGRLELKINL